MHHYSQVQVNMPVMQRLFKRLYNQYIDEALNNTVGLDKEAIRGRIAQNKNPYIQVKLLPTSDWAMVIRQYIHKGMQESAKPTA